MNMGLFQKWGGFRNSEDQRSGEECPSCLGKGFYQHGLEFAYIHDCPLCDGTGTYDPVE